MQTEKTVTYLILSNSGPGNLWKVEYSGLMGRVAAQRQAETEQRAHGGQWIVAVNK